MIIGIDARPLLSTPRTGVGEFTYELLFHLFQAHPEHQYILFANAFRTQSALPFQSEKNVTWVETKIPNKIFHASLSLLRTPKLDRYVAKRAGVKKIDIWFSPNLQFTALSKNVKHVLTIHDLSFEHYPTFYSRKGRMWHPAVHPKKQIESADMILVPSSHTKRDVVHTCKKEEQGVAIRTPGLCSHVAGDSAVSFQEVKEKYNLPESYMLYLGTLEPRKNIEGMLDAYASSNYLKNKMPFIFAGAVGNRGKEYAKMIEQTHGARYIGYIDESEKQALYAHARAFVYPSFYEGFGFPVLEAMSCGTPVVASNRTSLPEVVGQGGILVNPLNTAQLRHAMEEIVTNDTLYEQLVEKGKVHAMKFSWVRAAEQLNTICEQII